MDNEGRVIETTPPDPYDQDWENALRQAFTADFVKQLDRFDDLFKELLKVLLAVPGIYLAALKLASPPAGTVPNAPPATAFGWPNLLALALWGAAAYIVFKGLSPQRHQVLRATVFREEKLEETGKMTIDEFYQDIAEQKHKKLRLALLLFGGGVLAAVYGVYPL